MFAWVRLGGTLVLEKWIMAPFYWVYFPHLISAKGLLVAVPELWALQFAFSVVLWFVYDMIGLDIVGLARIKHEIAQSAAKMRSRFPRWGKFLDDHKKGAKAGEFVFFSWQMIAFLALLCMRVDGRRGRRLGELGMLASSVTVATLWWTVYSIGLYKPVMAMAQSIWASIKVYL